MVEVITGERDRSWYENTPDGPGRYWWAVFTMQQELLRRLALRDPDRRWINVGEVSAEGPGAGAGGGNGWVILSGHDADGAAAVNGPMNRWYGGMVHELGHASGLPDSSFTDGTPNDHRTARFGRSDVDGGRTVERRVEFDRTHALLAVRAKVLVADRNRQFSAAFP